MKLREYIEKTGVTQIKVAQQLGIGASYLSLLVREKKEPSARLQKRIDALINKARAGVNEPVEAVVTAERTGKREITIKITI